MGKNNWCKWSIVIGISLTICVITRAIYIKLSYIRGFHPLSLGIPSGSIETIFPHLKAFRFKVATYDLTRIALTLISLWAGVIVALYLIKEPIKNYKFYRGFVWGLIVTKEFPMFVSVWVVNFLSDALTKLPKIALYLPMASNYEDTPVLLLTPLLGGFLFGWLSEGSSYIMGALLTMITLLLVPPGYDSWSPLFSPFKCLMASLYCIMGAWGVYISNILKAKRNIALTSMNNSLMDLKQ